MLSYSPCAFVRNFATATAAGALLLAAAAPAARAQYRQARLMTNRNCVLDGAMMYPYALEGQSQSCTGHAQLSTRDVHPTPDFLISGRKVLARTPNDQCCYWGAGCNPGPSWYGLPAGTIVRIPAQIGSTQVWFNPFNDLSDYAPAEYRLAQDRFLYDTGLVGHARIVRRAQQPVHRVKDGDADEVSSNDTPQPKAIIHIENLSTEHLPLEASTDPATGQVTICSADYAQALGTTTSDITVNQKTPEPALASSANN